MLGRADKRWISALQYAAAVLSVVLATLLRLALQPYVGAGIPYVTYFLTNALIIRFTQAGPSVAAIVLSAVAAQYFFLPPTHTFHTNPAQLLTSALFLLASAVIMAIAHDLRRAKTRAEASEHAVRDRAALLDLAPVFGVHLDGTISTWGRGAEMLYGFSNSEALGRLSRDLLKTSHPDGKPLELIVAEVLSSGRWEGELIRTCKGGKTITVLTQWAVHRDAQGLPTTILETCRNITPRKRAERAAEAARQALEHQRNLLETVMNGAGSVHLAYLDPQFNFVHVNEAYARTSGYTPEEIVGKNHFALYPHEENQAIFTRVRDTGQSVEYQDKPFEFPEHPERGTTYWDWTLTPAKNTSGAVVGLVFCLFETTSRKRAELALSQTEERLRFVVESIPHLVWSAKADGFTDFHNRRCCDYFGVSAEQLQGWSWLSFVHPDDLAPSKCAWDNALNMETEYCHEYRLRRGSDAQYRWHFSHAVPLREADGRIVRWFGTCTDIHDRKLAEDALRRSEERFRRLVEVSAQIVWVADPDGQPFEDSPSWRAFTGRTYEQWIGWNWLDVIHPEDRNRLTEAWHNAVRTQSSFEIEFRMLHHSGQYRSVVSRAVPLLNPEGSVRKWIGMNTDITDRKKLFDELTEARDRLRRYVLDLETIVKDRTASLEDLVRELEHFSYTITHDLRAPLRAMKGFAQLIENESCDDCEFKGFLQRITTGASRMDLLITDALQYTRCLSAPIELSPVNTDDLLRGIISSYPNLQAVHADIAIAGHLPPVLGNEAALTQCFSNILGNAVKFVASGTRPAVRIRAERVRLAARASNLDSRVRLWFEDNGIGIDPKLLPKLFAMFQRGNHKYEGTGIGLALVRKNLERMGGKVGVESTPGQGSRFWIELQEVVAAPSPLAR